MVSYTVPGIAADDAGRVVSPCGTPCALVAQRPWDDYSVGRTLATAGARNRKHAAKAARTS